MNKKTTSTAVALILAATHVFAALPDGSVNKLANCSPLIADSLRNQGSFDIKCRDGNVASFCMSDKNAPWPEFEFFAANSQLFGLKREDVFNCNKHPCQRWKGVTIFPGMGFSGYVVRGSDDSSIKCMRASIVDTRSWTLDVRPTISSSTAKALALKLWKAQAPNGKFSVDIADLQINREPQLIWSIGGIWHKKDANYRVTCYVDARPLKANSHMGCSLNPIGKSL